MRSAWHQTDIMASDQAQFEALLQSLMSPDNQVRKQSEDAYESIPGPSKIPLLISAMRNTTATLEVRTMGAVLLRRIYGSAIFEEEIWPQFPPEAQAKVKEEMLGSVEHETNGIVRKKVCDCTAEFARTQFDENGNMTWTEILKFLFDCASSQNAGLRESALNIFSAVPGIFGTQQSQYLDVIKQMLQQCFADQNNPQVRFAAVKATCSFLLSNEKEVSVQHHFRDLLPAIIQGVADSVSNQDDDAILKCLIDLAESCPKYLRPQLETIVNMCMKIIGDANVSDNWRQLAMEVIVSLAESAPAMIRKFGKFLGNLVPQVLAMMVDLEDDPEWSKSDEVEEEDNDSNSIAAESALDRLACSLGGKTMLPHIIANIPTMLANSDWKYRHAALMAISACGEGCHKQMELMLNDIVGAVLPFMEDPHPRVRYAACNALGQMSTDFGPTFQKKFHDKVVPGLLMVLDDNSNPRVQAHAGAALVNFSEDCPKTILAPYLDPLIAKLELVLQAKFKELLEQGNKLVLEQVVTTLASVADTAEEKFVNYYDRFMPMLKYIIQNAVQAELRLLRGKTIECVSLIGLAVGRDKFLQDCGAIMQLLLESQTQESQETADDDPQVSYMISAWARMCKIMGKDFEQYLPLVMGPVLKAASLKPDVMIVDEDEMKTLENDVDWQFVTLGDQQSFGIRTAGLEDKATACQMLVCYARELKEGFAAYTEQVVKIMVQHLKFYFHDGVRIAAAESLPYLLDCAKMRGPQYIHDMWHFICPELLKAIDTEPENEIKSEHMQALAQCIKKMGKGCLNSEQAAEMLRILEDILKEHDKRQIQRHEQRKDEDYDEDVEEGLLDEDDEDVFILTKISDIIHAMFGTHKEEFLPLFNKLLPQFTNLIQADRPWADKQWGLCIFDDVIEHTGPHSLNYQQYFVQPMLQYICDKQCELRQAAAYGIGVMAQFGGEGYAQTLTEATPLLIKVIQDPESRSVENLSATENAISAVTKICKYNPGNMNVTEVLPHWLSWLPTWEDEDEAEHIYGYLCDLVEANNPQILGENNQNLPRILEIISEVFRREALSNSEAVAKRLVNIVKQIQTNGELFQACLTQLSPEQQNALCTALATS